MTLRTILQTIVFMPKRKILWLMGFLSVLIIYANRVCLSVAIVEIVKPLNQTINTEGEHCVLPENFTSKAPLKENQYLWTENTQGWIFSSFFIGYTITQVPGGYLAEIYGGKWVLGSGILSTAIITLLTPISINIGGSTLLIILRTFAGLSEGLVFPALSTLLAQWVPESERSFCVSFVYSGVQVGMISGTLISGFILSYFQVWSAVFYFFGTCSIIWYIFFLCLCFDKPRSHPYITDEELAFLKREIRTAHGFKILPAPYFLILKNYAVIAIILAEIGHSFGFYIMVAYLPKYLYNILHVDIEENVMYSSLTFLCMLIMNIFSGILCYFLIARNICSITIARKIFTSVSLFIPALCLIGASYAGCDKDLVISLFTLAIGAMGTYYVGAKANALDLSLNYAGTLAAFTNGVGSITGIFAAYIVGVLTTTQSIAEWRIVFWIAFCLKYLSCIAFIFWASGDVQEFDHVTKPRRITFNI